MYLNTLYQEMNQKNKKYRFLIFKNRYFIQFIQIIQLFLYSMILASIILPILIIYNLAIQDYKIEFTLIALLILSFSIYKTIQIHLKHTKQWINNYQIQKKQIRNKLNLYNAKSNRLIQDIEEIRKQIGLKHIGNQFEEEVLLKLSTIKKGYLISNVIVKTNYGITEVDSILIHPTGIHVFETKNLSGKLVGKVNDHYWIQYVRKSKKKVFNPYKQNELHIHYLKDYLKPLKDIPFIPYLVFHDQTDTDQVESLKDQTITSLSHVTQEVQNQLDLLPQVLKKRDMKRLKKILMKCQSNDTLEKHHLNQFFNGKYDYLKDY